MKTHFTQSLSVLASLFAVTLSSGCGGRLVLDRGQPADLNAVEVEARSRLAAAYGAETDTSSAVEMPASPVSQGYTVNSTDDEIIEAILAHLRDSLEKLQAIDRGLIESERAARFDRLEDQLSGLISRLESDASLRHEFAERERAQLVFRGSQEFYEQREAARVSFCGHLTTLLSQGVFPSEEIRLAVQRSYDQSCSSS